MKNGLLYMFLLLIVATSSQSAFSQRRGGEGEGGEGQGTIPRVILHPTITHATCFNPTGSISYYIEVANPGWTKGTKVNHLDLYDENGEDPISLTDNGCCGTISNLSPGMYTFSGSMTVTTSTGMLVSVLINVNVWLGIETVWTEKIDMVTSPNSYSAKRNASTVSYGGVRSSNGITSGDGWIEMSAVFGNTTDNRVFLMIGETNPLGVFNPSSIFQQYIEFYKGVSGNGIRVWYNDQVGGIWGNYYTSISTNPNDKIRVLRTGSSLTIQKNNSNSTVFTLPQPYSGAMNIAVRSLALDDGCLDVISTFPCKMTQSFVSHAELKRKLDGGHTLALEGGLKFTFDGEYEVSANTVLNYSIYNKDRSIVGGYDIQGNLVSGSIDLNYQFDDNRYLLDVSGMNLTQDEYYILNVVDSKGNKQYLKFKFIY